MAIDLSKLKTADQKLKEQREAMKTTFVAAVQNYLDDQAQVLLYDGILSLCTYALSTNTKFAAEGKAGVKLRDDCWSSLYKLLDDVNAGRKPIPKIEDYLKELPKLTVTV